MKGVSSRHQQQQRRTMSVTTDQNQTAARELVEIVGAEIVIRVPLDAIPVAAAVAWETRSLREMKVTDIPVFAVELVRQLRREKENGETLVTDMLDAAVIRAVEDGAEGFELGESPV